MAEQLERPADFWYPDEDYYERIADRDVSSFMHWACRVGVSAYSAYETGRVVTDTTPCFDAMQAEIAQGNTITVGTHRNRLETVLYPIAQERVGIHHAGPMSKLELFQKRYERYVMHKLGAWIVDKNGDADMAGMMLAVDGILHRGDNNPGKRRGVFRRKVVNGNGMIYPEGERKTTDVRNVGKIKRGTAIIALVNGSLILPSASAGLSVEKDERGNVLHRDAKTKFGRGPRVVINFHDPFRLEPLSIPLGADGSFSESPRDSHSQLRELRERSELIRESLQKSLTRAYEVRDEVSSEETGYAA